MFTTNKCSTNFGTQRNDVILGFLKQKHHWNLSQVHAKHTTVVKQYTTAQRLHRLTMFSWNYSVHCWAPLHWGHRENVHCSVQPVDCQQHYYDCHNHSSAARQCLMMATRWTRPRTVACTRNLAATNTPHHVSVSLLRQQLHRQHSQLLWRSLLQVLQDCLSLSKIVSVSARQSRIVRLHYPLSNLDTASWVPGSRFRTQVSLNFKTQITQTSVGLKHWFSMSECFHVFGAKNDECVLRCMNRAYPMPFTVWAFTMKEQSPVLFWLYKR